MADIKKENRYLNLVIIDDDDFIRQSLAMSVPAPWKVFSTNSPETLPQLPNNMQYQCAFVDLHLKDGEIWGSQKDQEASGLDAMKMLRKQDPHMEIVAISGDLDPELMEKCLRAGASRFLAKPLSPAEVSMTLDKIEALLLLRHTNSQVSKDKGNWIGESPASREVVKRIASLKGEDGPLYIEGESGTGKEVVATLLHQQEGEHRPFVAINVASIHESIFESELFGHVRGAFTGADKNKMGLIEAAHNGDLFLDEIEALPMSQQAKLLRFLETGEIRRVGCRETLHVKVRVLSASNQCLQQMAAEGKFREDLLWRLCGKRIQLPPLRERGEDIVLLAQHFMDQEKPRRNKTLTEGAKQRLKLHNWPGNVRELRRACEQICLYSPLPLVRAEDVSTVLPPLASSSIIPDGFTFDLDRGLKDLVQEFESELLQRVLDQTSDVQEAALLLKVPAATLQKRIRDLKIKAYLS